MSSVASTLLPVALLILLGALTRSASIITSAETQGIKLLILKVLLPAVLFLAFLSMELELRYLWLAASTVVMLTLFMGVGYLLSRSVGKLRLLPFHVTGFSFGFLGIPLFALVFGRENLGIYTVLGVGHELFVWFVYYPLLARSYRTVDQDNRFGLIAFLRSPIVVAIAAGILANLLGIQGWLSASGTGRAVDETLHILADATTPLILIVVGHSLSFHPAVLKVGVPTLLIRFAVTFGLGYPFKLLVMEPILASGEPLFDAAFFSLIVLPGLYSLPIFLAQHGDHRGEAEASGVVTLGSAVSVLLFLIYVAIRGPAGAGL
ncbi:MAG: AEC family transporter [Alkalispirochaetaceae bacterium]